MKKLLVLVLIAVAVVPVLIPTDASAVVVCWLITTGGVNDAYCGQLDFGPPQVSTPLSGFFFLNGRTCGGVQFQPTNGDIFILNTGGAVSVQVGMAVWLNGTGAPCITAGVRGNLSPATFSGPGTFRNFDGSNSGAATWTFAGIFADATLEQVMGHAAALVAANPAAAGGSPLGSETGSGSGGMGGP
jgi:hypothetical protein